MMGHDYVIQMWQNLLITIYSGNIVQDKSKDRG